MKHAEQQSTTEIGKLVQTERKRQGVTQLQLAGMAETARPMSFFSPRDVENLPYYLQAIVSLALIVFTA